MPTNRVPLRRRVRGQLSFDQEQCLWLGCGRQDDPFPFADEDEARELWERHRGRLMTEHARGGRRPHAWWAFESPIPRPDPDREASVLYDNDLLEPDERAELIERWREHFDKAQAPGFSYCVGQHPTRPEALWLSGRKAREAHYRWADIPASLVARWTEERRKAAGAELVGESLQNYETPE